MLQIMQYYPASEVLHNVAVATAKNKIKSDVVQYKPSAFFFVTSVTCV